MDSLRLNKKNAVLFYTVLLVLTQSGVVHASFQSWCAKNGFQRLVAGYGVIRDPDAAWDAFYKSYLEDLKHLAQPFLDLDTSLRKEIAHHIHGSGANSENAAMRRSYAAFVLYSYLTGDLIPKSHSSVDTLMYFQWLRDQVPGQFPLPARDVENQVLRLLPNPTELARDLTLFPSPAQIELTSEQEALLKTWEAVTQKKLPSALAALDSKALKTLAKAIEIEGLKNAESSEGQKHFRLQVLRALLDRKFKTPEELAALFYQQLGIDRWRVQQGIRTLLQQDPAMGEHWAAVGLHESELDWLYRAESLLNIKPGQTLVDIGSGAGTPGLFFGIRHPGLRTVGYELVPLKVDAAKAAADRLGLKNVSFVAQNVADKNFSPPVADYYYLFNPVNKEILEKVLQDLHAHAQTGKKFKLVVFRGVKEDHEWVNPALRPLTWLREVNPNDRGRIAVYEVP